MINEITREYNYSDIYLLPNPCIVNSRSECDTTVKLGKKTFAAPVVASNMKSVVDENTCKYFAKNNWFYIYHRFGLSLADFYEQMAREGYFTSGSIGVNEDSYTQLKDLLERKWEYNYLCLDIAHADSPKSYKMIDYIKSNFPNTFLIVGNVATREAVINLQKMKIDAIKCGISNGHVCETFRASGYGRPQFTTDLECCEVAEIPVISDGAASCVGDICKSLVAGSTMKMLGNMMAGYSESAGQIIQTESGHMKKEYYGSASYENKLSNSNIIRKNIEGKRILVDFKGPMDILLQDIKDGISSGVSYAGGKDLSAFLKVKYVYATPRHW